MHSLAEMKYRLGELSGLRVPIEFNVTIKANPKGLKPIKVEDRLRYLTDKKSIADQTAQGARTGRGITYPGRIG